MDPSSASSLVSSSGCKKQKVDQTVIDVADRISKLPDMALQHIISFLSIKDAVRTCILSKRFDNMWTSVPNLCLYNDEDNVRDLFMNFVERVLTHRDFSSLHVFELECLVYGDVLRINTWISAAIRRKVEVLDITLLDIKASLVLPHGLFNSNSLKTLHLKMSHILALPSSICFSSLWSLSLDHIIFPNDHLTQQFFSGCPVLEELDLCKCNWINLRAVSISCPNLKKLSIREKGKDDRAGGGCQVMILTTSLEFLYLEDGFRNDYFLSDACSLVRTSLVVVNYIKPVRVREVAYRLHKLLKALKNTNKLELSSKVVEYLSSVKELFVHVPVFNSLTHLVLDTEVVRLDLEGLHKILQNSPHIEYLHFADGIELAFWSPEIDDQKIFNPVPSCFTSHLKTIRVDEITGSENEMSAVKILLARGTVLEKMVIRLHNPRNAVLRQKVHEQLLLVPRNSACSIIIVDPKNSAPWDC